MTNYLKIWGPFRSSDRGGIEHGVQVQWGFMALRIDWRMYHLTLTYRAYERDFTVFAERALAYVDSRRMASVPPDPVEQDAMVGDVGPPIRGSLVPVLRSMLEQRDLDDVTACAIARMKIVANQRRIT